MRIMPKTFAAMILILLGMLVPLFVHAEEEDPILSDKCAKTNPELKKIFGNEMEFLKRLEGFWTDISTRPKGTMGYRVFLFNATKNSIQIQLSATSAAVVTKSSKPMDVTICRTKSGVMRVLGPGIEVDMLVLNNKSMRFKIGGVWQNFYRNQDVHMSFFPVTEGIEKASADGAKKPAPTDAVN